MEHPDLAQFAAVLAAAGAALLLAGRGRAAVVGALALLALGEIGLAASSADLGRLDTLASASGALAVVLGLAVLTGAAAVFARRPAWVPVAVLAAAPLRPPIAFDTSGGFPLALAEDGQLGRLLPLYFVLAAAALALAWRAARPDRTQTGAARALPRAVAFPAAAFIGYAALSVLWADSLEQGVELLAYFTLPFALLLGVGARAPFPDWTPRALARVGIALAAAFAAVGLYQSVTHDLLFFAPNLEVSNANSDFFRVTSLFGDPSLYGRHVVLGIGVLLVLLALQRVDLRLGIGLLAVMWAGLLFSYSQSSMVALVAITLGVAVATGGRNTRLLVVGGVALVTLLGVGYLVTSVAIRDESLRTVTADRSERVEDTIRVVEDEPILGVGLGGQPRASRRLAGSDRSTPTFVSHTTPLTVAAELGLIGLVLYTWLLVGGARAIVAVRRLEPAMGLALGAAFLGLFVHALFYSGFLEDPLTWVVLGVAAGQLTWTRIDDGVHRERPQSDPAAATA
ncbi:MAG TPA: O-antigen ligase family protein [Thermoleophilaceae bacterium]|nr:O-antigen ligase family protein [Thermoleophilaceae bacterium]